MTTKKESTKKEREDKIIEESLQAIYGNDEVDFSKLEKSKNRLTGILLTIVISLSLIAVTAWSGFFIYTEYFQTETEDIFILEIEADEEIVSGSKTSLTIYYKNPTNSPVASLQIEAKLPPAFHTLSVTPAPTSAEKLIWDIGYLNTGSDGSIIIEGVWVAEIPSSTPVQAFANFRPSNFNSDFQDIATVYLTSSESNLETQFEGIEEGRPGETLNYKFTIENKGEEEVANIITSLILPNGFFIESSKPKIESGEPTEWSFDAIAPGAKEEITFTGSFAADTEGFQYFDIKTFIIDGERKLKQTTAEGFTDVIGDNLSLQLVANGSTENVAIEMGKELRVSLAVENNGENDIENLSLLLDFEEELSLPIDWESAILDEGVTTKDGIFWDNETLGILTAGEKRIFNLVFPVDTKVTAAQADEFNLVVRASIDGFEIKSKPIYVAINSEADFDAEARYFTEEGAPLGSGPIPPKVDELTTYRIFWKISNELHGLENIKVQAVLPPHIDWGNRFDTDLGSIKFDEATRSVTWSLVELPKDITEVSATFAISITPDSDDIGKFIKLISGSSMTLKDKKTGDTITESTESITTELQNDEFASGKGTVLE